MSKRYGDRGFGGYGDPEEDRTNDTDYERERYRGYGEYGARRERDYDVGRGGDYGSGRGDYGRDYGYERDARDYGSREYGARDYGTREEHSRYGPARYGGRTGSAARRYEGEQYGREYGRADYGRESGRDYERAYGRAAEDERDPEGVRSFDTDYGRTTSPFYGRSGYEYGREDYDEREPARGYYGRRAYGRREDEREERGQHARGWWDRAADEVLSWFGGEGGERDPRREEQRAGRGAGKFRGRGPRNYRRSDERIREDVSDRLSDNEWLDASDVDVNVTAGEVILSGTVDSRYAKRLAEDIAESVSGVTNVQNNLRVRGQQSGESGTTGALDSAILAGTTAATGAPAFPGTTEAAGTTDLGRTDATDVTQVPPTGGASRAAGGS